MNFPKSQRELKHVFDTIDTIGSNPGIIKPI